MSSVSIRDKVGTRFYQTHRLLLESGLLPSAKDYTRFIVLARSRTGSTMLRTALGTHTQSEVFGELFQKLGQIRWQSKYGRSPQPVSGAMAWPYVQDHVFRAYPSGIKAVGFKLFYYHAQEGDWPQLWHGLQGACDLHVIHVKRLNILDMIISRKFAHLRESWALRRPDAGHTAQAPRTEQVTLDYLECMHVFKETRRWHQEYDSFFEGHPQLEATYEDMASDFALQSRRVQSFLGLDYENITPVTKKQARRAQNDRFANYDELKMQFAGSEWAGFFTA